MIRLERLKLIKEMITQLPDYFYFKEHYQLIAIDLSNQQKLDADPKAIQEINFNINLEKKCNNIFHY